jgi:hypothetical protein
LIFQFSSPPSSMPCAHQSPMPPPPVTISFHPLTLIFLGYIVLFIEYSPQCLPRGRLFEVILTHFVHCFHKRMDYLGWQNFSWCFLKAASKWNLGRDMAHSRRPLTTKARVRALVSTFRICDGQSGTEAGFSPSSSVFLCQYHSTVAPYLYIIC